METSVFNEHLFHDYSPESVGGVMSPMAPKAIQHHSNHQYISHNSHNTMLGNLNGEMQQHQRLPDVQNILPGSSPKMEHYKSDYGIHKVEYNVKIESSQYSPNTKIEYMNGIAKMEPYSPNNKNMEYSSVNGQYSPNSKIIEYSQPGIKMDYEHQMFQHPQPIDNIQHTILMNNNFKRKSDENLNNLSGSSTPTTINNISPNEASSTTNVNKKPTDKKKNDPNGVKKKKTR